MKSFEYLSPGTLEEVFAVLDEQGSSVRLFAGGTDAMVRMRMGIWRPDVVLDIKRVEELRSDISETASGLRVGALVTMTQLMEDARITKHFQALAEAASVVGSVQIRNRATLAGNICNASPAADTASALLVYQAAVNLVSSNGQRTVALAEFFTGPGKTVVQRGELVESIDLPIEQESAGSAFGRITRRRGVDLATINLSCLVKRSGETRFAYGAVGPRPFLVTDESGVLANPAAALQEKTEVIKRLIAFATPRSDVRSQSDYRSAMLAVMSRRTLDTAMTRTPQSEEAA